MLARNDDDAKSGYYEASQRCQRAKGPEIHVMSVWDGALVCAKLERPRRREPGLGPCEIRGSAPVSGSRAANYTMLNEGDLPG